MPLGGNDLLQEASADIKQRLLSMKNEQDLILLKNKAAFEDCADCSETSCKKMVIDDLGRDLEHISKLNIDIISYPDQEQLTHSIKTHKMNQVLCGSLGILQSEDNAIRIASGGLPRGYSNEVSESFMPSIGGDFFWGSSRSTYLSGALLSVNFTLKKTDINSRDLDSSITHVSLFPQDFQSEDYGRYFYRREEYKGLGFIHSGFAFGGYRFEDKLFPAGKVFGPEDCSSWVRKVSDFSYNYDTIDLFRSYRKQTKSGYVEPEWEQSDLAKELVKHYQPVEPQNLEPGDLFFYRAFDTTKGSCKDSLGIGGHVAIVAERPMNGVVKTICCTRDMPEKEGFGLSLYSTHQQQISEEKFYIPAGFRYKT